MSEIHYRIELGEAHLSALDWIKVIEALKEKFSRKLQEMQNQELRVSPPVLQKQTIKASTTETTNKMCFSHKWRDEGLCIFQMESEINMVSNAAFELGKLYCNS